MFGIGMPELIIIMVVALIIIGPSKLPDLAKALGKGMAEFRKATQEIKDSLNVNEEFKAAKEDLVDSITGLNEPGVGEIGKNAEGKSPEYSDFDDMVADYEQSEEGVGTEAPPADDAARPKEKATDESR
jgi:sec-independent protein translocase protein TatB